MTKIEKIINFYVLTNTLKDKIRSGVSLWNISKERLESVAEHVYGVCMLAIAIDSEYDFKIDIKKVVLMLAIHELEECYIGDLTPFDNITKEKKKIIGEEATEKILEPLVKKAEYLSLTKEFNEKITKESKFANYCDKLEMMLQMKLYEEGGYSNLYSDKNEHLVKQEWIQELIRNGSSSIADLFFDYHLTSFEDNEVFKEIARYAKDNKILDNTEDIQN